MGHIDIAFKRQEDGELVLKRVCDEQGKYPNCDRAFWADDERGVVLRVLTEGAVS